jgi:hypothetical protein
MNTPQKLYVVMAAAFTATLAAGLLLTAGVMPTLIVCGSMAAGLVGWALTSLRLPTDPRRILPVYLITAAMLYLHITEEMVYGFGPRIGALTGTGWTEAQFIFEFVFVLPLFWILGALALWFRHLLGGFMSWFIFVGMFLGEPTHLLVFPLAEGGRYHYFPGMWTAMLPMVMGFWGLHVILSDWRQRRGSVT